MVMEHVFADGEGFCSAVVFTRPSQHRAPAHRSYYPTDLPVVCTSKRKVGISSWTKAWGSCSVVLVHRWWRGLGVGDRSNCSEKKTGRPNIKCCGNGRQQRLETLMNTGAIAWWVNRRKRRIFRRQLRLWLSTHFRFIGVWRLTDAFETFILNLYWRPPPRLDPVPTHSRHFLSHPETFQTPQC